MSSKFICPPDNEQCTLQDVVVRLEHIVVDHGRAVLRTSGAIYQEFQRMSTVLLLHGYYTVGLHFSNTRSCVSSMVALPRSNRDLFGFLSNSSYSKSTISPKTQGVPECVVCMGVCVIPRTYCHARVDAPVLIAPLLPFYPPSRAVIPRTPLDTCSNPVLSILQR